MAELIQAFDVLAADSDSKESFSIKHTLAKTRNKKVNVVFSTEN